MVSGYNTAGMVLRDALGRDEWQEYAAPAVTSLPADASELVPLSGAAAA
jgi:hypothetical protein